MNKKRTMSMLLVLVFVLSFASPVSAKERLLLGKYTIEQVSEITGYPVNDLKRYEKKVGDKFESEVAKFIERAQAPRAQRSGISVMSWGDNSGSGLPFSVSTYARVGYIHVTADDSTPIINHGHAALAVSSTKNLEIYNKNDTSKVRSNDIWNTVDTYALLSVDVSYTDRKKAAEYGSEHLVGLSYDFLASTDSSKVNCASLVTKTYKESGVLDMYPWFGWSTIIPLDLVNNSHTTKYKVHNFPW
ncbi:hypothetical protein [Oceanirhabdus sp. W0125-5]|uniref:hypothetical protein n=1 Tax=Oceanirhabdus sp. W0125-5 TaxID=2999116 RepID=UPI0022F2DC22|nr:hypothetical protein [Oceanirhabdus sp. W0125-5]WBW99497.1 hypothetical protein OW730_12335 [Oceanirhabdus sp. W0125-5]